MPPEKPTTIFLSSISIYLPVVPQILTIEIIFGFTIFTAVTFDIAMMVTDTEVTPAEAVQDASASTGFFPHRFVKQLIERATDPTPAGDDLVVVRAVFVIVTHRSYRSEERRVGT